jgi:ATP-dependent helicase/nuclease subunit A
VHTSLAPMAPTGAHAQRWRRVLVDLDSAEVETLARALASFAPAGHAAASGLPDARAALAARASDALARIADCPMYGETKGPESWLTAARASFEALRDGGLAAFRAALDEARWRDGKNTEKELLEGSDPASKQNEKAAELVKDLRRLVRRLRQIEQEVLAEAVELVRPFADAVRAQARRRGILPFDALLWLARELLRKEPGVRRALGARYDVLFVDEFQDTDPVQYEIVFFLAEEPGLFPAADAFATRLAPGRLFIVGDPKQAIYRFRGADLAAYHAAVEHIVERNGGVRYTLTCNWRARPEVLAPLEKLLREQLEPPAPASAPAYSGYDPLESGREPAGEARVERWRVGDPSARMNAEQTRQVEAEAIAAFVLREVSEARAQPGDFALLFRSLRDVRIYARALRERGIECWIGRSDEPHREPAPQQLLALLRSLANPADAPAVLGVARSPLGAVPDAELARWAASFEPSARARAWSYPDVAPADALPNLQRTFALLRELRARARSLAPADLLASLLEDTPLLAIHARARDGQRRVRDLESLLERLADAARSTPGCALGDLVRALEASDPRSVEDDDARSDRVRLLTIHGAKGLEFHTVFLPDLARPKGNPRKSVEVERVREPSALAVKTRAGSSASWLDFEAELALHETAELGRLFYVATTRARERLIFVDAHRRPRAGTLAQFIAPFDDVRDVGTPEPVRVDPEPRREPDLEPERARTRAALERAHATLRPPFRSPSGVREDEAAREEVERERREPARSELGAQHLSRTVGMLAHDALERWDFRDAATLRRLAREGAARAAPRAGVDPILLQREADALVDALLATDLPAYLAARDVLARELPLLFQDADGTAWSGTIDLLYRDPDGRIVIADYKTDRAPDAAARARYRAQLAVYARAVARAFADEPSPDAELIFVRTGQRERLPREDLEMQARPPA